MGNETGDDLFFWRSPHHRRDRGLDLRKSVPVFEREPIIDPKIWLHEMRPSTVPVFAFAKADTQMEVETADAPTVGVISKKKGHLGVPSGRTATLPSHNSSLQ